MKNRALKPGRPMVRGRPGSFLLPILDSAFLTPAQTGRGL